MRSLTMSQAINEALREEMRSQPTLILLGQDIGPYGGTFGVYRGLFEEFGEDRVRDGPLCESATVGFAIGAAINGMRTVVELEFMDFVTVAMDQIVNQAAKMHYFFGGQINVPMVIRTPIVSRMGMGSQHSQSLEAWFMHVPGLKIAIPSNAYDAKGLLKTALRDSNPVLFVENVRLYSTKSEVPETDYSIPFGQARVLREGSDLTMVAISGTVPVALAAADQLAQKEVSVEVVDPRTLNPFDIETLAGSLRKTGKVLITHDGYRTAGVGAEIGQRLAEEAFNYLDAPILRVTGQDVPVTSGDLHLAMVPNCDTLVKASMELMGKG
ncbi:MAG TPA: alpha-ketoacid dehydrogenase subunit beta [Terriglobia bacterium]|nr:alpha-ketoacid dehydrogenase subunit beta [Terriglobia bacterium]